MRCRAYCLQIRYDDWYLYTFSTPQIEFVDICRLISTHDYVAYCTRIRLDHSCTLSTLHSLTWLTVVHCYHPILTACQAFLFRVAYYPRLRFDDSCTFSARHNLNSSTVVAPSQDDITRTRNLNACNMKVCSRSSTNKMKTQWWDLSPADFFAFPAVACKGKHL